MDQHILVKNAILNFFLFRTDIFGDGTVYEGFKKMDTYQTTPDGFNSTLLFGQIIYSDKNGTSHESKPIVIKVTPKLKNSKFISYSFINEMNFYTKVVPILSTLDESFPSLFPQFYHGDMMFNVKEDQSVIIFEDLKAKGYQMAEKKSFLDRDHLILMMRKLGQFHAYSYKAKTDTPELFHPLANNNLETNSYVNREMRNMLPIVGQPGFKYLLQKYPQYEKYAPGIETMLQNADDIYIRTLSGDKENPVSVICHGDYLRNNVMFKYENNIPKDMVLIDLATYRYASPAVDLITVLYLNTDQKTRNELWDTLINEYHLALITTFPGSRVPGRSEILSEFVGRAFYAYLVASYFLPYLITSDDNSCTSNNESYSNYDCDISPEYYELGMYQVPVDILSKMILAEGSEASTKVLSEILRDMIDRGFICK